MPTGKKIPSLLEGSGQVVKPIANNLQWFLHSGILVDEGLEGVHERVLLLHPSHPLVNGNKLLEEGIFKYRRVDCALETAVAFYIAGKGVENPSLENVSKNLVGFVNKYDFQERNPKDKEFGLYAHGLTTLDALKQDMKSHPAVKKARGTYWNKKWVDDNSWAVITQLYLWDMDNGMGNEVAKSALICAEALLDKRETLQDYCRGQFDGVPHWGGMRNMALAQVYAITKDPRFKKEVLESMAADFKKIKSFKEGETNQPYDLSNTGYAVMQFSSIFKSLQDEQVLDSLNIIAQYLISRQHDGGHFPAEWWEGSQGENIADMIYGQNWASNALQMYNSVLQNLDAKQRAEEALSKAIRFLRKTQHESEDPLTNGAWFGSYDAKYCRPGGEDKKEGGPSSLYSGWTNAPILTCLLVDALCIDHPYFGADVQDKTEIGKIHEEARQEYEKHKQLISKVG